MTLKSSKYGGLRVFLKKPKYLLLRSDGPFIPGRGLHVGESAAEALGEVFGYGLASWPYVAIKGKKKTSYFLKTNTHQSQTNTHQNQTNKAM